jgi:hypothetical protein
MPADTKILPVPDAATGESIRYPLNLERCVIEVSLRPLGVRLARARLRARGGELVMTGRPPVASITMDVVAKPERVGVPWVAGLFRPAARRLSFAAADVDMIASVAVDGELEIAGVTTSLPLVARFVHVDEHAVVVAARGRGGRWLWIEAAVEFAR